jgi:hypothetical protein
MTDPDRWLLEDPGMGFAANLVTLDLNLPSRNLTRYQD